MLGDPARLCLRDYEGHNRMKKNGSFAYKELDILYRGMDYLVDYIYKDERFSHEEREILARPYRDMMHKIQLQREKIEDSQIKFEIKEFQRLGW